MIRVFIFLLAGTFAIGRCTLHAEEASPDFIKQIQPILTKYCAGCHNADDAEGKLALDNYDRLMKGGEHGAAIIPGRSETSRMMRMLLRQTEPFMPPKDEPAPTPAEIELLRRWIDGGAKGPTGQAPDPADFSVPRIKTTVTPRGSINAVAASSHGGMIAVARSTVVELRDADGRNVLRSLSGLRGNIQAVAFSRDGSRVVAAAGEPGLFGQARIWNVADGAIVQSFRGHKDALLCVQLSPDGKTLATGGYDQNIVLWDVATGQSLRTLEGHNGAVYEFAFHPSGKILASASGDRTVKLWRVDDGVRLDTLKESTKELYALAFHPQGESLVAGGVDNRIRSWRISPDGREGSNPLLASEFAHEASILRLAYSADGSTLASSGEDSLVKLWNSDLSPRESLERQSDWPTALAISSNGKRAIVGRLDGTLGGYDVKSPATDAADDIKPLPETPPEVSYGPQPKIEQLPKTAEVEPNNKVEQATALNVPGVATGRIFAPDAASGGDVDLFRITVKRDEQWIVETNAARSKSPLDTKIEMLDAAGSPVPRLLLRAVRDTELEFRGASSEQRGFRWKNWEEMLLNDYIFAGGEVIKHYQQRRGPDAESQFYPENGNRITFFDTTPVVHPLAATAYMVKPYPLGTRLPNNGLPTFTLNYENDDESLRRLGKDSRLTFVAPSDGDFFVRVSDVRRMSGENFSYQLIVRRPEPGFKVTLNGANPTVNAGGGKAFSVKVDRIDNFQGPIRVDIAGLPPGFAVSSPLVIPTGLFEAQGVIHTRPNTPASTEMNWGTTKVTATAQVAGNEVVNDVNNLGAVKLAPKGKVIVHLERDDQPPPNAPAPAADAPVDFPAIPEIVMEPGGTAKCRLRVERFGFNDRIAFDVDNLPHGVIVDDIGLSGVLIPEGQTERTILLRAESWMPEQERLFHAVAKVEGNQASAPMRILMRRPASKP